MQIRATFDGSGERVIAGSEDRRVYIWRTKNDQVKNIGTIGPAGGMAARRPGAIKLGGSASSAAITMGGSVAGVDGDLPHGYAASGGGSQLDLAAALGALPGGGGSGGGQSSALQVLGSSPGGVMVVGGSGAYPQSGASSISIASAAGAASVGTPGKASAAPKCMKVRSSEWFAADDGLQAPAADASAASGSGDGSTQRTSTAAGAIGSASRGGGAAGSGGGGGFLSWLCGCGCAAASSTTGIATGPVAAPDAAPVAATAGSSASAAAGAAPVSGAGGAGLYFAPGTGGVSAPGAGIGGGGGAELDVDNLDDIVARAEFNAYFTSSGRIATTVAMFAPPATLAIVRPASAMSAWKKPVTLPAEVHDAIPTTLEARIAYEAEVRSNHFIIVAADSRGFLRVYENTGPRFAAP